MNKMLIVDRIMEFWRELAPHVHYQAAIVDFVLVDNFQKVYCVEVNPFVRMDDYSPLNCTSSYDDNNHLHVCCCYYYYYYYYMSGSDDWEFAVSVVT